MANRTRSSLASLVKIYKHFSTNVAKKLDVQPTTVDAVLGAAASSLFANMVFLPLLSLALFVNYMAQHDFFSYDFFSEGVFGMKLFVVSMLIGLIVTSFGLFGSVVLLFAKKRGMSVPLVMIAIFLLLNTFFVLLLGLKLFDPESRIYVLFIFLLAIYLCIHFGVFLFSPFRKKMVLLLVLFVTSFGLVFSQPDVAERLLGTGLRSFGVGGQMPVEIYSEDGKVTGKLILLTPRYVYYKEDHDNELSLQSLDKLKKIHHISKSKGT